MTPFARSSERWGHQTKALHAFLDARNGVLEMATGSGKTRTALKIVDNLFSNNLAEFVIVAAHGTDLLDQWYGELLNRTSLRIYRAYAQHRDLQGFVNDRQDSVLLISLHNLAKALKKIEKEGYQKGLLICDEVHRLGANSFVRRLEGILCKFPYRLGLSATPEREYDQLGNKFIQKEIGPTIFRFTLEQAIEQGVLCELDYVALGYSLSSDDKTDIRNIVRAHYAKLKAGVPEPVETLYRNISRVRKTTSEKIGPFRQYVSENPSILQRCIIFVETAEYGLLVQSILMERRTDYHTYYQDDSRNNLKLFANGSLDCLITCHRISEGIDIRSVNNVILFSSSRAKIETIQRLGRCLRVDEENPKKRATVIDFVDSSLTESESRTDGYVNADEERRLWFASLSSIKTKEPIFVKAQLEAK